MIVENPAATAAFAEPQPKIVQGMVDHGMLKLTGKTDLKQAWRTFVSPKDIVGIKVSFRSGREQRDTPGGGQRRSYSRRTVESGVWRPSGHIIIWDKRLLDLRLAGFDDSGPRAKYQVRLAGAADVWLRRGHVYYGDSSDHRELWWPGIWNLTAMAKRRGAIPM